MERGAWLVVLLFQLIITVSSFTEVYPRINIEDKSDGGDLGNPLFLSEYIENGNIEEGRLLARVPLTDEFGITSYSGFFTVNKTYDSNQFFWYFPPIEVNGEDAAVIVWLQGGPGSSSLVGLFTENGPFEINSNNLELRTYNWASSYHVIYIDNPVGAGFSFTKDPEGYCTDQIQIGEQLYSTVYQFFKLFPELQQNKFFVIGQSYGGKYATSLSYTIDKKNPYADFKINLQGISIGNGMIDPEHQLVYSTYLYQIGLIDSHGAKVFETEENKYIELIKQEKYLEAYEIFDALILGYKAKYKTIYTNLTGFDYYFNYLYTSDYNSKFSIEGFLQQSEVRKAIHVGNLTFHDGETVKEHLYGDIMKSVFPWLSELLDHYNVVIYHGNLDVLFGYPLSISYLMNLSYTGAEEYKNAERHFWKVDGELAGYVKQGGRLLEVMVRNAGHKAPGDQPKWCLDLITRFINEETYYGSEN